MVSIAIEISLLVTIHLMFGLNKGKITSIKRINRVSIHHMLRLNKGENCCPQPIPSGFNTSYVKVKYALKIDIAKHLASFNTSYVKVKLYQRVQFGNGRRSFNTSYVKVKL